jgi:hypothetical protein
MCLPERPMLLQLTAAMTEASTIYASLVAELCQILSLKLSIGLHESSNPAGQAILCIQ